MSYKNAAEILSRLRGPVVPQEWQGGLPFTYHVGPGPTKIHVQVENTETIGTMRNVIGMIRGKEEPDKWVVVGNHRDAWLYGATDPSSGTAALLEVARSLGEVVKKGYSPKRSLVFANWDAEEDLLGGSTSWAQDHRAKLLKDGVVYVNLDSSASGPDFTGGSTPALADFLRDTTKYVNHPDVAGSVFDAWAARSDSGIAEVDTIVGATDYTAFQENIGLSCIDMSFDGPYGVYHSQYDNYFWMSRIGDPGFRYNTTMARVLSILLWRMANADVLPMRYSSYARSVIEYVDAIEEKAKGQHPLQLSAARKAANRWQETAEKFESKLDRLMLSGGELAADTRRRVNVLLMDVERAMTEEEGMKSRPFFKHLIYAPQPTYRQELLPRIFEAIEAGEWEEIERYEQQLVVAFDRAAALLDEAEALLP
jgi:N-acetylated-alpha-linked acidic dipeptidase